MTTTTTISTCADLLAFCRANDACQPALVWLEARDQSEAWTTALAACDKTEWRAWLAERLPIDQLQWAVTDPVCFVRVVAAARLMMARSALEGGR